MSCHAPNDRLLPGDGPLDKSIEVYYCQLELGHTGPHKSSGHPIWWDDSYHGVNDYVSKAAAEAAQPPDLDLSRALKAMLPPDAAEVASFLDLYAGDYIDPGSKTDQIVRRAAAILRGEP